MACPREGIVRFAPAEGAEVDMLVFMGAWVPTVTSEVPTDADDTIVRGEKISVTVFGPCCLSIAFELDR